MSRGTGHFPIGTIIRAGNERNGSNLLMTGIDPGYVKILQLPTPHNRLFSCIEKMIVMAPVTNWNLIALNKAIRNGAPVIISYLIGIFAHSFKESRQSILQGIPIPLLKQLRQRWRPGHTARKSCDLVAEESPDRFPEFRSKMLPILFMCGFDKISNCIWIQCVYVFPKILKVLHCCLQDDFNMPSTFRGLPVQLFGGITGKKSFPVVLGQSTHLKNIFPVTRTNKSSQIHWIRPLDRIHLLIRIGMEGIRLCQNNLSPWQNLLHRFWPAFLHHQAFQRLCLKLGMIQQDLSAAYPAGIWIFIVQPYFQSMFLCFLHGDSHFAEPLFRQIRHRKALTGMYKKSSYALAFHLPNLSCNFSVFHLSIPEPKWLNTES